jgi:glycosyltransferase involved in cell wall biosynthesis
VTINPSQESPVRVLLVSHRSRLYGAERSLSDLAYGLLSRDNIRPLVLLPSSGPLADQLKARGIPYKIIPKYQPWISASFFRRVMLLLPRWLWNRYSLYAGMRVIRKKRISLVYVNTISSPYGYYLARKSSLPFVWHVREFVEEDMQHKFDFGFGHVCKALGKANAVIFKSNAVADKYKLCAKPKSSSVIYNGFDFNGIRPREERLPSLDIGIKLVIAGSIQPGKGQIDAIMASSVLIDKGYKLQLDVIGKGKKDYERYLRRRIRSMGIENNVSWIGRVKDVSGYFCDADAVLVCSRSEAFGRVSVEALALGVPVIASRSGGSIEVMIENEIGLLYEPGDFNDLADKIQELINDRERYLRFSRRAASSVRERFPMDMYVENIESALLDHAITHIPAPTDTAKTGQSAA